MMKKQESGYPEKEKDKPGEGYYLGIDPGRDKTGAAIVDEKGAILTVRVLRTRSLADGLQRFLQETLQVSNSWALRKKLRAVVIGNGTASGEHKKTVARLLPGIPLYDVDERNSTEEARDLYWELFPPKGWRKLIPLGLQVPPEPLDGLAAVVQVRRFLQQQKEVTK